MNKTIRDPRLPDVRSGHCGFLLAGFFLLCAFSASAQENLPDSLATNHFFITGKLQDARLDEISGVAVSGSRRGVLYVHNDSGDTSRFFAVDPGGKLLNIYYFKGLEGGRGVRDCEDIAIGAGERAGRNYVYIGDIGDNRAVRSCITVYRLEEPDQPGSARTHKKKSTTRMSSSATGTDSSDVKSSFVKTSAIRLVYPDGPRDAETLMIDPQDGLLYILSKREDSIRIYTAPWQFPGKGIAATEPIRLQKRGSFYFKGVKPFKYITAGDISRDGRQVLLKSYSQVFYWKRQGHEPLWETIQRIPRLLPYIPEKQGEAIGFTPDGKAYYTTSEGVHAPIYYYEIAPQAL